jgi:ubiquinone/menaquinone biosynthesis C-methylase UbiE
MVPPDNSAQDRAAANEVRRRAYARDAPVYDKQMGIFERWIFGADHRRWACSRAVGNTLEVAVGTGLNLPHYPPSVRLTAIDLSPEMLDLARARARAVDRAVALQEADAQDLPFQDRSFDSAVCTYSLCNVPDEARTLVEMKRVLKPGGRLILVDHVRSTIKVLYWLQRLIEVVSGRAEGEYMTRRPFDHVRALGFVIQEHDRQRAGVVERLVAVKPRQ